MQLPFDFCIAMLYIALTAMVITILGVITAGISTSFFIYICNKCKGF